jgi:ABC-type transporter Mla subunit MlaD
MPADRVEVLTAEVLERHLPAIEDAAGPNVAVLVREAFHAALERCQEVAKALNFEGPLSDIPKAARAVVQDLERLRVDFKELHDKAHAFAEQNADLRQRLSEVQAMLDAVLMSPPESLPH